MFFIFFPFPSTGSEMYFEIKAIKRSQFRKKTDKKHRSIIHNIRLGRLHYLAVTQIRKKRVEQKIENEIE